MHSRYRCILYAAVTVIAVYLLAVVASLNTNVPGSTWRMRGLKSAGSAGDGLKRNIVTRERDVSIWQAWNMYCHRTKNCGYQANIPKRAYLISMPKHQDKREHSVDLLEALGLEVEVIEGKEGDQVNSKLSPF